MKSSEAWRAGGRSAGANGLGAELEVMEVFQSHVLRVGGPEDGRAEVNHLGFLWVIWPSLGWWP